MKISRMAYSRLIGALFLSAILFYGGGLALVTSVIGAADFLSTISAHQTTLDLGAFLMLLNSVVVVSLAVLLFPILENHSKRTAVAYLASRSIEAVLLAVGVLCLLMIPTLGQHAADAWAKGLGSFLVQANTMSYQIAVTSLGLGSVFFSLLLFRTRLIPQLLAAWGVIGYAIFLAGAIAEIFGIHIGVALSIPGGLFEVGLGIWLLIRGFQPEAYEVSP